MDIHIFYRHMSLSNEIFSRDVKKIRPDFFSYEKCFSNLIRTILEDKKKDKVTLHIMFDGTEEDFNNDFVFQYKHFDFIKINLISAKSDSKSYKITINYAKDLILDSNTIFYFLENDYLHQRNWLTKVFNLFKFDLIEYASLYDHRDKYMYEMYFDLVSKIVATEDHHWRTAPNTCASYLVRKSAFDRDFNLLNAELKDHLMFDILIRQLGRNLVTPIPGLSTHCMHNYLSPCVDWESVPI